MIQVNELRMGNLLYYTSPINIDIVDEIYKVDIKCLKSISSNINHKYKKAFKPIPLTEEWLLKFGFEVVGNDKDQFKKDIDSNYAIIITGYNCWIGYIDDDINDIQLRDVSTIHQLQNLYFALTQTELTIKL